MAYGARLESVLGLRPQGFESPILRKRYHLLETIRILGPVSGQVPLPPCEFQGFHLQELSRGSRSLDSTSIQS